jgi:hypothetical protein
VCAHVCMSEALCHAATSNGPLCPAQASNEWGYINDTQIQIQNRGPSGWKGVCQYGEKQSPVDLALKKLASGGKGKLTDLIFNYKDVERTFVTNMGHGTPQVNFSEGNETIINGETFSLLQFHFHTPSEHAFDGQRFAMEAHLVGHPFSPSFASSFCGNEHPLLPHSCIPTSGCSSDPAPLPTPTGAQEQDFGQLCCCWRDAGAICAQEQRLPGPRTRQRA